MKKVINKITKVIQVIFGYGIMICLLVGGLTALGYIAAIVIGGETAQVICAFIYERMYPVLVIMSTSMILLGLIKMYLAGESEFSGKKSKKKEKEKQIAQ